MGSLCCICKNIRISNAKRCWLLRRSKSLRLTVFSTYIYFFKNIKQNTYDKKKLSLSSLSLFSFCFSVSPFFSISIFLCFFILCFSFFALFIFSLLFFNSLFFSLLLFFFLSFPFFLLNSSLLLKFSRFWDKQCSTISCYDFSQNCLLF